MPLHVLRKILIYIYIHMLLSTSLFCSVHIYFQVSLLYLSVWLILLGFVRFEHLKAKKKTSMVWVRERTIPTERPPLVGNVIANFLRIEGATWSAWRIPTAVFSVFYTGAATFLSSSSSVVLTRLSGPRSRPTTFFLSGSDGNRTRASGSVAKNSDH
jgi:hypothetical protein